MADPAPPRPRALAALVEAAPDFLLAGAALLTWLAPDLVGPDRVRYFVLLMLLEFVVVHSAGFLGAVALSDAPAPARVRSTVGLGLFYTLFVLGFSLGFSAWWPLLAFWGLTLNRLLGALLGRRLDGEQRRYVMRGWAAGVVCYLAGVMATVLLPVPRFGLTRTLVSGLDLPGSGVWISQPHRAVAFAVVYFGLMGCSELVGHRWLRHSDVGSG